MNVAVNANRYGSPVRLASQVPKLPGKGLADVGTSICAGNYGTSAGRARGRTARYLHGDPARTLSKPIRNSASLSRIQISLSSLRVRTVRLPALMNSCWSPAFGSSCSSNNIVSMPGLHRNVYNRSVRLTPKAALFRSNRKRGR